MSVDTPPDADGPYRSQLFEMLHKRPMFMRPLGYSSEQWGAPWKVLPSDWIDGPTGAILVKDIILPSGAPGQIDGFSFGNHQKMEKNANYVCWFVKIEKIDVPGHSAMRLSRIVCVPEFTYHSSTVPIESI